MQERRVDIPPAGPDAPHGRLHRPLGNEQQIGVAIAAFFGGPALGWATGGVVGDLSETARLGGGELMAGGLRQHIDGKRIMLDSGRLRATSCKSRGA